jgi:hypothetical protein
VCELVQNARKFCDRPVTVGVLPPSYRMWTITVRLLQWGICRRCVGRVIVEGMCRCLHVDISYFDKRLVLVSHKFGTVRTT